MNTNAGIGIGGSTKGFARPILIRIAVIFCRHCPFASEIIVLLRPVQA